MLAGLRRESRVASRHGWRLLSVGDNLSSLLAFEKGRSANEAVRRLCARAAAIQVGCEIPWSLRYVEAGRNPADGPSRLANADFLKPGQTVVGRFAESLLVKLQRWQRPTEWGDTGVGTEGGATLTRRPRVEGTSATCDNEAASGGDIDHGNAVFAESDDGGEGVFGYQVGDGHVIESGAGEERAGLGARSGGEPGGLADAAAALGRAASPRSRAQSSCDAPCSWISAIAGSRGKPQSSGARPSRRDPGGLRSVSRVARPQRRSS